MITNRDLDRQLSGWFESRATSIAPDGLLERSLARVDAARQRPGWLVPDRWRFGDAPALPSSTSARFGLILVLLLAVVLVATAVGGLFNRLPTLIVEPSPSPSLATGPTASPSAASPSPSSSATRLPSKASPARPGMFADLTDLFPASDTVGWVSTNSALYRTTDTGASWTEIRPFGASSTASHHYVDEDTMYAADADSPVTIAATHDGGLSWTEARLDVGPNMGGPVFSFQTPAHGFATFYDLNGSSLMPVYATTDGGVTWTGPEAGKVPHLEASMDKLYPPTGGFLVQSAGKFDNKPFDNRFFLSVDGGVTWMQYTFPIDPALAPKNAMKQVEGILREPDGRILLEISADGGRNPIPNSIYESGADTATWRRIMPLPATFGAQFLSATEWLLFSGPLAEARMTIDGGATWRTTNAPSSTYDFESIRFATADTGWATEACRYASPPVSYCDARGQATVLLATIDGGATWTQIGP